MKIIKPELDNLQESIQVFLYSIWGIIYYTGLILKSNLHRYIHIVWLIVFSIIGSITQISLFAAIALIPTLIYSVLWIILKNKLS